MIDEPRAPANQDEALPPPLQEIVDVIDDHKGYDLVVLDLRGIASFTDFMLICTGRSERHVQAIVDAILERMADLGTKPLHTEGREQAHWVLVDFVDFLVNVFTPDTRDFYHLEKLWRDAPVLAERSLEAASGEGPAAGDEAAARDG